MCGGAVDSDMAPILVAYTDPQHGPWNTKFHPAEPRTAATLVWKLHSQPPRQKHHAESDPTESQLRTKSWIQSGFPTKTRRDIYIWTLGRPRNYVHTTAMSPASSMSQWQNFHLSQRVGIICLALSHFRRVTEAKLCAATPPRT